MSAVSAIAVARSRPGVSHAAATMGLVCLASGCEPELVVGTWACPEALAADGGALRSEDKVVDVPWNAAFEHEFCDYARIGGFCYASQGASYSTVAAPVRGGHGAAAFSVTGASTNDAQARCFREGALPRDAVYGAWFYVPAIVENAGNWNLMHFQGGAPGDLHGLWDVSLSTTDDGAISLYAYDFLHRVRLATDDEAPPSAPIGAWFHVELRLRRAADDTGAVALYQDGSLVARAEALSTDDTEFGQWYLGNLVDAPSDSTVYVDDVSIRGAP